MSDEDRAAQIAAIAARLDAIPTGKAHTGRRYALHPKQAAVFAEELYDKGLRVHADLATVFAVPGKQRGAMPYASLPDWVNAEDYAQYVAQNPGAAALVAEQDKPSVAQLEAALAAVDPELAARLSTMTPAERDAARAEYAAKVPAALKRLAEIADRNHTLKQAALRNAPKGGAQ